MSGIINHEKLKGLPFPEKSTLLKGKTRAGKSTLMRQWFNSLGGQRREFSTLPGEYYQSENVRYVWVKESELMAMFDRGLAQDVLKVMKTMQYVFMNEIFNRYNFDAAQYRAKVIAAYFDLFDLFDENRNITVIGSTNHSPKIAIPDAEDSLLSRCDDVFPIRIEL